MHTEGVVNLESVPPCPFVVALGRVGDPAISSTDVEIVSPGRGHQPHQDAHKEKRARRSLAELHQDPKAKSNGEEARLGGVP
ncbi:hypothetical protein BHE74_00048852 [Ensete ventricosum]|nr:hypothetical protein GW17_00019217 [Ensete ventricosum]RWW45330.1 hypothetical protein BHE74_00048852 [Ensete ventricosum]RZS03774.1 hypothetical protein BHM03_00034004 [Ensete ventricosum]